VLNKKKICCNSKGACVFADETASVNEPSRKFSREAKKNAFYLEQSCYFGCRAVDIRSFAIAIFIRPSWDGVGWWKKKKNKTKCQKKTCVTNTLFYIVTVTRRTVPTKNEAAGRVRF
jgi:hypothetical protein